MQDDEFGDNIDWSAVDLPSISASMMVAQPRPQEEGYSSSQCAPAGVRSGGEAALQRDQWNHGRNNVTSQRESLSSASAVVSFGGGVGDGSGGRATFSSVRNTGNIGNIYDNQQRGRIGGSHCSNEGEKSGSTVSPSHISLNIEESLRRQVSFVFEKKQFIGDFFL